MSLGRPNLGVLCGSSGGPWLLVETPLGNPWGILLDLRTSLRDLANLILFAPPGSSSVYKC